MLKYKLLREISAKLEAIDVAAALLAPKASPTFTGTVTLPAAVSAPSFPTAADNAAAVTAGLAVGKVYKTATGELRIVV